MLMQKLDDFGSFVTLLDEKVCYLKELKLTLMVNVQWWLNLILMLGIMENVESIVFHVYLKDIDFVCR